MKNNYAADITLRIAIEEDMLNVWEWRNDSVTIANSFDSVYITMEKHDAWFMDALTNSNKVLLIGCKGEEKVGLVRFDRLSEGVSEISINVSPTFRKQGIGTIMLKKSLSWVKGRVIARIKEDNMISLSAFEKAGFRFEDRTEGIVKMVVQA